MSAVTAPSTAPWLTCRGLSKRYGGVLALDGVDLDLRAGEVHGLIGPNGAGKSTLVKLLSAAVPSDAGVVTVDGQDVRLHDPADAQAQRIVLMPQEIAVVPEASVIDNITLGSEATRWGLRDPAANRRIAADALAVLDLDLDLDAQAATLSAAHQRMLMMARALHRRARLLILDEPTAGLAQHEAALVTAAVRRLLDHDLSVIYVSHHLTEVAELCDRVTCIRGGRVAATIAGDEVQRERLVSLIVGAPATDQEADDAAPLVTASDVPKVDGVATDTQSATSRTGGSASPTLELVEVSGKRLRGLSLTAAPGSVLGITGLLGSGVTEAVQLLVGERRPETGTVRIDGVDVVLRSPAAALSRGVGYLAGDRTRAALTAMTIRENVSLSALQRWCGRIGLLRPASERARTAAALDVLSVQGDQERPLGALSGGNQQRALVSRLIAAEVRVLVLDEPTVGVDVGARAQLWSAVRELAVDHTVVVASSEPEELVAMCDRVVCIRHGAVSAILTDATLTEHAITSAVA
ncbi:sugar ABC transporter ATP-binding protein [Patulibacter minatonensis]|uniref:sugar ABC transporter ATP-binding protein n=1 Tax=Patulibacter minatonensis TaxID=298163 RepID=UPI000684ECAD|nr:sugar ABC transporter ATP-binding protein [Patulibacter minatonensis]